MYIKYTYFIFNPTTFKVHILLKTSKSVTLCL